MSAPCQGAAVNLEYVKVFNPGPVPVTVDAEGHVIQASAWFDADPEDSVTAKLLADGLIVEVK